jgi:DNA invertase Pin-like site-specific DNA recombinase
MLTVLGGLAEFEKELIRARTGEERERAKTRGVKIDRPGIPHVCLPDRLRLADTSDAPGSNKSLL